ncbi:MAG TPA: DNA-directed RNA polymerase subunit L [Candidatus Woesearchaeota archaeon]|nr:DNA-directed RNA polymerase subunit L [Candidatus Woesearchaeota archaeon]
MFINITKTLFLGVFMEINVIEEKKDKISFELKGEGNTFCNLLKDELWNDKHVTVAAYNIKHPLIGIPFMIVETDGNKTPRQALASAAERLANKAEKLRKEAKKALK